MTGRTNIVDEIVDEAPVEVAEIVEVEAPVEDRDPSDQSLQRGPKESQQEYNERIPVGQQPVQPGPTRTYLGDKL